MSSINSKRCVALILAAGSSSRMGRPKQLLSWGEDTILQNAINSAKDSACEEVVVVLGANSEIIQKTLQSDVISVVNTNWENGMGSSIACGMQFVLRQKERFTTILVMLGDQPLIDSDYLDSMLSHFQFNDKDIVATAYNGRAGVPALFGSKYFKQLEILDTEFGAKELLAKNSSDIHLMNAGVNTADIDTEADYIKLNKLNR